MRCAKSVQTPKISFMSFVDYNGSVSDFEPYGEARAAAFRQIFRSREATVELGDQLHDVQAEAKVWPVIAAGA